MGEHTGIEWADATINLWWGCTKVSPACTHCYAETLAARFGQAWGPGAERVRKRGAQALALKLNRRAERTGERLRVFALSMGDWLDDEVPAGWLADLLNLVRVTPALTWMLLTKRPQLWRARLEAALAVALEGEEGLGTFVGDWLDGRAPANVWAGATIEDQARCDERLPELLAIPAAVRFASCEPLLGPVLIERDVLEAGELRWIIGGGESGRGARPTHPAWACSLRDQAKEYGAAFFWKQWGEFVVPAQAPPGVDVTHFSLERRSVDEDVVFVRVGKKEAGRLLDGREWSEVPA